VWVFKGVLFLALLFALVYFFVTNSEQSVDINFFGTAFLGISIYWVVVVSFLLGFASSFTLAAFREFRFHREIGNLRRQHAAKDKEIADLRTLPLKATSGSEGKKTQARVGQGE
jgi:uncharacterized integral membrane protein